MDGLVLQSFDIIAIAEMTPGPIAVNSATFVGYRAAGIWRTVPFWVSIPFSIDPYYFRYFFKFQITLVQ